MSKGIYLDYAAATPVDPRVLKAMKPYFSEKFHNPSAGYLRAKEAREALELARADAAGRLGARPAELVFTAGATEANNLAIQGVMKAHPQGEVLASAIDHESVLEPAKLYSRRLIPVDKNGIVDLGKLKKMVTPRTTLVCVGLVNNELGTLQPLGKIAALISESRKSRKNHDMPLYLHSDAAQAPNYLDIHVARLGIDLLSINGSKIYGPKQSGILYVKAGTKLEPLIVGGGQESNIRSGTENVPATIGLAAALGLAQENRKQEAVRIRRLRNLFIEELLTKSPGCAVNGSDKHSAPHIVSVTIPGKDNERLMMELDEAGVQAATGSACAAGGQEPSHVLTAIGLSDKQARSTLRFSFGRQTTEKDVRTAAAVLSGLV